MRRFLFEFYLSTRELGSPSTLVDTSCLVNDGAGLFLQAPNPHERCEGLSVALPTQKGADFSVRTVPPEVIG